jgi:16S rRNA (uracil1498-N3)-methyltransferase
VRVFDGRGSEFAGVVESDGRDARVRLGERVPPAPEPRVALMLAHAVLKGDKMDDVIRDATMIGAAAVQPIVTARTEVARSALERGRRRERWQRIAISSAKQCGRAVVPEVAPPCSFDDLVASIANGDRPSPALMLVEPQAAASAMALRDLDVATPAAATLVIGPEGGWTPQEIAAAVSHCRTMTLGGRTLRADAMGVVAVAALFARWGEY